MTNDITFNDEQQNVFNNLINNLDIIKYCNME